MDYQKYFVDSNQKVDCFLSRLSPDNLCPFAAHTIFPYLFSFQKGSWFRWEKSKNSVVVQCPNSESCLAFRIIKESSNSISAKVINKKSDCLAGHKIGDIFQLTQVGNRPLKRACCHLNEIKSLSVSVIKHSQQCRYYKEPGQIVLFDNLIPKGFCLPAYYLVYPYALSLLYDGNDFEKAGRERTAEISCPDNKGCVKVQINTKRNVLSSFLNLLEKAFRFAGLPKDVLDKSIEMKIREIVGNCPKNLRQDQIFNFNLYNSQELCPAVFYNLFPYFIMLNRKIFPYWTKNRKQIDIHCPDAGADIVHRISIVNK